MITQFSTVKGLFPIRLSMLVLAFLMSLSTALAESFITDVMLIGGSKTTVDNLKATYTSQGWYVVNKDLNAGCGSASDFIYLLYKADTSPNINLGYITDFYITDASRPVNSTVSYGGRTYNLVPYEGDSHFRDMQGDLNSNAGGADIHLYYTKDLKDNKAITGITFNATSSGAVGLKGGSGGYDLNKGCGSETDYIYMHVTAASATIPSLSGGGTSANPFIIKNANDWMGFVANVYYGKNTDKYYKLADNFSDQTNINKMVGTQTYPFKGTLDGNGKTVFFNINSQVQGTAPFYIVDGATIMNLETRGVVTNNLTHHSAGLVGLCGSTSPITIKNCTVKVNVSGSGYAGGIVGHGGHGSLTLENCSYMGTISNFRNFAGGLVGWCDALQLTIKNCFMGGYMNPSGGKCHPIALKNAGSTVTANVTGLYYLRNSFPYDGLGSSAIPEVTATPVSNEFVRGDWEDEVTIMGGKYYKLSTPKKLDYQIGFEYGTCDWTRLDMNVNSGIVSDVKRSGQFSFNFISTYHDQYLISPEMNALSNIVLKFCTKGSNYKLNVGYSRTTNNLDAFNWAQEVEITVDNWTDMTVTLPGGIKYIAIKSVKSSSSFCIDDLTISAPYPVPEDLTASNLTDRSITISWTRPLSDNLIGYFWKLKKASSVDDWIADNSINNPDETSVTLTGLEPSTKYQFYIQALYMGAQTSSTLVMEFTTDEAIAYLPYSYAFENGMNGWVIQNPASGTCITNDLQYEGEYSFMFDTMNQGYQILHSPLFEEGKTIKASFYCRSVDAGQPATMAIGTVGAEGGIVNIIDTYQVKGSVWSKIETVLPEGARHFCIIWLNNESASGKLYVDDIKFTETLRLTFPKEGYLAYYEGGRTLVLPKGMKARVVSKVCDDGTLEYTTVADGYCGTDESDKAEDHVISNDVLPHTPVILQVAPSNREQTFYVDYEAPMASPHHFDNYLRGSDTETTTIGGDYFYKLGYNNDDNYGWIYGASNGGAFTAKAHEAWLALSAAKARGISYFELLDFDKSAATGINGLKDSNDSKELIFNLAGQRIEKTQKGINIINGKKIIIK